MTDKMSAEPSKWTNASNKHYTSSNTNSIHIFKVRPIRKIVFTLLEEKEHEEIAFFNIHLPSRFITKLYILFCELKFEVTSLQSIS